MQATGVGRQVQDPVGVLLVYHQRIFYRLRHQSGGKQHVLAVLAHVARDIDNPQQLAIGRQHRAGAATDAMIGGQKMLLPQYADFLLFTEGGADGIGAHALLVPAGTVGQCHLLGLVAEVGITGAKQYGAFGVGKQQPAATALL